MRADLYRLWTWVALPAAAWFTVECGLHVAFGDVLAALSAAGLAFVAGASVFAAKTRLAALPRIR